MSIISPWHMWGTQETVECTTGIIAATASRPVDRQLARVNYRRPESWAFLLTAEVVQAPVSPAADFVIQVNFNLMAGVGRATWNSKSPRVIDYNTLGAEAAFHKVQWYAPGGLKDWRRQWCTSVMSPSPIETYPPGTDPPGTLTEFFVAETIQCEVSVAAFSTGADPQQQVKVQVGAYFAPLSHVRPDWFCENFTGETGGK